MRKTVILPTLFFISLLSIATVNQALATGGVNVIGELIEPMIKDVEKAIQSGDTDKALSILEEIQGELKDLYEAD